MKKFITKLLIFLLPFILFASYIAYEILVLPIDHFTFRAWEALRVYENTSILSGPFYPNNYLKKKEFGDLSGLTKYPVPKEVEWYTDNYGYRKKARQNETYEVVVIGDSAIAGSALTQSDMFTEKLGEKINVDVYAFAPSNFNKFLDDKRFVENPPDLVIFESAEKLVSHIPAIISEDQKIKKKDVILFNTYMSRIAVYIDRLKKEAFINYLYARLTEIPKKIMTGNVSFKKVLNRQEVGVPTSIPEMAFYSEPEDYFKDWQQLHINRVVEILKDYEDELQKKGTKLIFMPIPNKENIYWELVNSGKPNDNLKRLITRAENEGIVTIDLFTPYQKIHNDDPNILLYHLDDSHWNSYGVEVAVTQAIDKMHN